MHLEIIDYSDKCIVLTGDTKPIKDEIKKMGGRWNNNLKDGVAGWIFQKNHRVILERFIKEKTGVSVSSSSKVSLPSSVPSTSLENVCCPGCPYYGKYIEILKILSSPIPLSKPLDTIKEESEETKEVKQIKSSVKDTKESGKEFVKKDKQSDKSESSVEEIDSDSEESDDFKPPVLLRPKRK